jgi:hypothetical protein
VRVVCVAGVLRTGRARGWERRRREEEEEDHIRFATWG